MEQLREDFGTRKDLVMYRLQSVRQKKFVMPAVMMIFI